MNEKCWFIYGLRTATRFMGVLRYHSEGSPVWVKFDWERAMGKVIGFYHSHPSGLTEPSDKDDRTMKAWVISEGKPMICGIFCDRSYRTFLYHRSKDLILRTEIPARLMNKRIFLSNIAKVLNPRIKII